MRRTLSIAAGMLLAMIIFTGATPNRDAGAQVLGGTVTVGCGTTASASATVSLLGTTTVTLPAACTAPGTILTITGPVGVTVGNLALVGLNGQVVLSLPNVALSLGGVTATIPQAQTSNPATVSVACGTNSGGSAVVSVTGVTTITLPVICSAPGTTLTLLGPAGVTIPSLSLLGPDGVLLVTLPNVSLLGATSGVTTVLPLGTTTQQPACGSFLTTPAFSSGNPQLAQVVFCGTIAQLDTAMRSVGANGAWAQTSTGAFRIYIVGAPAFANAEFMTAFPSGFPTVTALTLVKQ